ncbi:MAG: TerB family tellurite resistance protein [Gemmatimonadetes bacterium]|uniref:TerB family tellurite resistance protein n=1 Tax=Candidatus Kutchimonas denitrificans TaxID=3056748 RepID=A0AAE4ZAI8_9BACT|nr:TerB family tellurite resistance protein [Gemmatimonadota bacterium]NIR73840.1 TerB family tellurite resistance protein [Candidatus Kutchimonas denitrificans]NIS02485.1 TerB family tellurite resistance protein [Gemmatimonadota bacterium]NIT68353.1 TerB family tellurite resistance protein [Gemmatimonadota bacterium]NIU51620.1 hypothetical protein [Gemmatimonadota bacterium]
MSSDWSYAHDLVNMYLGIAQLADNDLAEEEERTFTEKFREWMPHMREEEFEGIWKDVRALYDSLGSKDNRYAVYLQSILNVAQLLGDSPDQLKYVIRDLVSIAGADGVLHDNEATMIKATAVAYGFDVSLEQDEETGVVKALVAERE